MPTKIPGTNIGAGPPPKAKPPPPKRQAPVHSEISTGLTQPTKRRQAPKQAPSPEDVVHPSFTSPKAPVPTGPPVPILQRYGVHMSIHDANDRVQRITDAYHAKFGMLPSRGLVFDVLRAPTDDFASLFAVVPHSGAVARAQQAVAGHGPDPLAPSRPHEAELIDQLAAATREGRLHEFEAENGGEIQDLLKNPKWSGKAFAALTGSSPAAKRAQARLKADIEPNPVLSQETLLERFAPDQARAELQRTYLENKGHNDSDDMDDLLDAIEGLRRRQAARLLRDTLGGDDA